MEADGLVDVDLDVELVRLVLEVRGVEGPKQPENGRCWFLFRREAKVSNYNEIQARGNIFLSTCLDESVNSRQKANRVVKKYIMASIWNIAR